MNRLKQLRLEKNLLQSDVAKEINVSSRAIGFYENNKRNMKPDIVIKLADYFGVSIDYLLGKTDVRNINDINFANSGGIDVNGLDDEDIKELQKQIDYIKKLKGNK